MWYSNFLKAKQVYVDVLEMLIPVADVHFTFNPSNHDYQRVFSWLTASVHGSGITRISPLIVQLHTESILLMVHH
jgi:hypothetical protein